MAKRFDDTNQGTNGSAATASFSDATGHMREFGKWVASFNVSCLSGGELDELVAVLGGVESQVGLCRANVLAHIKQLGGDPIGSQKAKAKSSHSASKKRADTAASLSEMPNVKAKMGNGAGMSPDKAALLAGAAKKTSAGEIDDDQTLLDKVETQDEDKAKQTIDKWVRNRQSDKKRKSQRQKTVDERQFWMFLKDGKVHTHGNLPADVANIARYRRWDAERTRLWRLDGGRKNAHRSLRSKDQRGADAWENIQEGIDGQVGGKRDRDDWCADIDNNPPAQSPEPPSKPSTGASSGPEPSAQASPDPQPPMPTAPAAPSTATSAASVPNRSQVVISVRNETLDTDDADVMADIIGGGPLLRSELRRHMCGSDLYAVLFDASGRNPLWEGRRVRMCTDAQWRALLVRDGACVLTGADSSHCEAHHVIPSNAPARGPTNIDNLVMVSVAVHHWLHDNHLTIYREPDGSWNTRPATPEEIAPRRQKTRE